MTVYPGLIDSETHLGLTEIEAEKMTNDLVELSDEIMPQMHVRCVPCRIGVDSGHATTTEFSTPSSRLPTRTLFPGKTPSSSCRAFCDGNADRS